MIPWFQYTTVYLGPIPIQVWGFFVALGMGLGLWLLKKQAEEKKISSEELFDIAFWVLIFGVIGSRLGHILFYDIDYFLANPVDIIKIWQGGMSSFGGMFGAAAGFLFMIKKKKKSRETLLAYADLFGWASLYGWIVGRIGCLMIHDHLGKPCDCFLSIQTPDGPRLEMSLLEILGLLPLASYFFLTRKRTRKAGETLAIIAMYYGILRFILDFFRATDLPHSDVRYFGLTPAQYFAMVFVVFGVWLLSKQKGNSKTNHL
jgi:phosphatidylglycerol:prolipoprotein diacylglycerol transferase